MGTSGTWLLITCATALATSTTAQLTSGYVQQLLPLEGPLILPQLLPLPDEAVRFRTLPGDVYYEDNFGYHQITSQDYPSESIPTSGFVQAVETPVYDPFVATMQYNFDFVPPSIRIDKSGKPIAVVPFKPPKRKPTKEAPSPPRPEPSQPLTEIPQGLKTPSKPQSLKTPSKPQIAPSQVQIEPSKPQITSPIQAEPSKPQTVPLQGLKRPYKPQTTASQLQPEISQQIVPPYKAPLAPYKAPLAPYQPSAPYQASSVKQAPYPAKLTSPSAPYPASPPAPTFDQDEVYTPDYLSSYRDSKESQGVFRSGELFENADIPIPEPKFIFTRVHGRGLFDSGTVGQLRLGRGSYSYLSPDNVPVYMLDVSTS